MPGEYIPSPQLPEGLVQSIAQLISQRGSAWGNAFQNLGQSLGGGIAGYGQSVGQRAQRQKQQQAQNLSPQQIQALQGMTQGQPPASGTFPNGITPQGQSLYEKMLGQGKGMMTLTPQMASSPQLSDMNLTPGTQIPVAAFNKLMSGGPVAPTDLDNENSMKVNGHKWPGSTITPSQQKELSEQAKAKESKNGSDQNLTQEETDALKDATLRENNPLAPSEITFRGPRAKIMAQALLKDPNWSPNKAEAGLAGAKAGATATASTSAGIKVNLDSSHTAFTSVMDKASGIADKMGQSDIAAFNKMVQSGKMQLNDPDAIKLYAYMDEAAGNYARIKKGGNTSVTQEEERDAMKFLSNKLNSGGIKAVQDAAETEYQGRVDGLSKSDKAKTPKSSIKSFIPSADDIDAELKKRGVQ